MRGRARRRSSYCAHLLPLCQCSVGARTTRLATRARAISRRVFRSRGRSLCRRRSPRRCAMRFRVRLGLLAFYGHSLWHDALQRVLPRALGRGHRVGGVCCCCIRLDFTGSTLLPFRSRSARAHRHRIVDGGCGVSFASALRPRRACGEGSGSESTRQSPPPSKPSGMLGGWVVPPPRQGRSGERGGLVSPHGRTKFKLSCARAP
eukprot:scaffold58292_cov31-Tisochrysis_lutea.AAC.2